MAPATFTCDRDPATIVRRLAGTYRGGDVELARSARRAMLRAVGPQVHQRGLLEFSNHCARNCYYCGIRRAARLDLDGERRYALSEDQIVAVAQLCRDAGFGSMTLQSGERRDRRFVRFVEHVLRRIKRETVTSALPQGLGITLCVGEQSREDYERFFEAGAHRYLLRVETSSPELFAQLHPQEQTLERRVHALRDLKQIGYQLGTGVMIGLPGQTLEDLARDVQFFEQIDADMIGMGPYIEPIGTPARLMRRRGLVAQQTPTDRFRLSLRMIAVTRLALPDVNIAATTALQALSPFGREAGLAHGANVVMPIVTPNSVRAAYQLYEGKPCVEDSADACVSCTARRVAAVARPVSHDVWGDAPHATKRISA